MITQGFTFSYSDLAVNDVAFPLPSTYLWVQTAGDLVYEAPDGSAQWVQGATPGLWPISAVSILATGVVNGVARNTTTTGVMYCSAPVY